MNMSKNLHVETMRQSRTETSIDQWSIDQWRKRILLTAGGFTRHL